ncbi:DUF6588 family protein [Tenacibaculum sp.]|uniref:DUF6588 family protein n=1 Tax=Tenacibaculum sp. TaxID=1906242 RepID=UPI003D0B1A0A
MKKIKLLAFLFLISSSLFSQVVDTGFEAILLAPKNDANKLVNAYMNPAMKGLIYSMNNGWYHTAKVHKKFGFDISIGFNGSMISSKDETFAFKDLNLSSDVIPLQATTPTVAGEDSNKAIVDVNTDINGTPVTARFEMPGGIKDDLPLNAVPAPAIQASMGLPFKMDVILRFVPKVGSDDVKGGLFGIGLKKEITDWFGPLDKTPLHVSLLATYTNMGVDYTIVDDNSSDNIDIENGKVDFDLNSYTVQAIASLNFPVINVYGGVGYTGGSSSMNMLGTYTLRYNGLAQPRVLTDPLNIKSNASGFKATLGTRLSVGFFKLFADYTLQEYNAFNAGIAFSFR